ncbi:hypothetical protein COOONC_25528 [Cooperia oncophora]
MKLYGSHLKWFFHEHLIQWKVPREWHNKDIGSDMSGGTILRKHRLHYMRCGTIQSRMLACRGTHRQRNFALSLTDGMLCFLLCTAGTRETFTRFNESDVHGGPLLVTCSFHEIFEKRTTERDGLGTTTRDFPRCQELNVFTHRMTKCSTEKNICKVRVSEVLKVNSFKREACLKLRGNSTTLREVRVTWDSLLLVCEPQSMLFTRDTTYHASCVNEKCTPINRSSVVPELSEGNQYPGVTSCVESCGGLGCDCFWWGSGCLFYRVYLKPRAQQVYEVFRCTRWTEAVKVKLKHSNALNGKTTSYVALLNPNIPLKWLSYSFTLSSVAVPPLPSLNVPFITDGRNTALWDSHLVPPLQCSTADAADKLQCEVMENCVCNPAETKANCNCREINISAWFQNLQNRLPVRTPSLTFFRDREGRVVARVPSMTTSEIILSLDEDLETELLVEESICRVDDAFLIGVTNAQKEQ